MSFQVSSDMTVTYAQVSMQNVTGLSSSFRSTVQGLFSTDPRNASGSVFSVSMLTLLTYLQTV